MGPAGRARLRSRYTVPIAVDTEGLAIILPELATQGLPLHIVWQRSRQHSPKVQALIAHFEQTLHIGTDIRA